MTDPAPPAPARNPLIVDGAAFERPPGQRPAGGSFDEVMRWLAEAAPQIERSEEMFDELCWRLIACGLPVARGAVQIGWLHPQFLGFGCTFRRASGRTQLTYVVHGMRETQFYRRSPIRVMYETGEAVRRRIGPPDGPHDFPILADLAAEGMTDYFAMPLSIARSQRNSTTWATDRPGGFAEEHLAMLERLRPLLGLVIEIRALRGIATNLLDTYLGRHAGRRVLDGVITRGAGETIRAVIWASDLRGFTSLSDRLPGERVIALLNAYFERLVAPVHAEGGQVLKFIGDGLLAIFPVEDAEFAAIAARRALAAAQAGLAAIDALPAAELPEGVSRLNMAVALHLGDVIYGNIGAPDRLDFTAIGPAVNVVSRLEQLSKRLDRRLLFTDAFRLAWRQPAQSLGVHPLRGVAEPIEVFTVPDPT